MGARLRELRIRRRAQGRPLAANIGISSGYLVDVEMDRRIPSDEVIEAWCKALEANPDGIKKQAAKQRKARVLQRFAAELGRAS